MEEVYYRTWDQFKGDFWEHLRSSDALCKRDFIFRGQGDVRWPLEPSIVRLFPTERGTVLKRLQDDLLNEFVQGLRLARECVPESEREQWALAQHYEMPTPLLDWSASPYVAAFFAFETALLQLARIERREIAGSKDRVAIFALRRYGEIDSGPADRSVKTHWRGMGVQIFDDFNRRNLRIRNQRGLFTRLPYGHRHLDSLVEEFCRRHDIDVDGFLVKFTMPYSATIDAIEDLELMDITPRRIYGDLIGVCKAAVFTTKVSYYRQA
jgi:hypothetical protein